MWAEEFVTNKAEFSFIARNAFYAALLPHLKAYGITAEFPADKPSTETYISGIDFDIWIGKPPHAIRYGRTQESFYSLAYDDKLLEASALANLETGDKLFSRSSPATAFRVTIIHRDLVWPLR